MMAIDPDAPATRRAIAGGAVILLHVLALVGLAATGNVPPALRAVLPARLILQERAPPPPPPPIPLPSLAAPPVLFVPVPDVAIANPPPARAMPQAITRKLPAPATTGHFGAATDAGLGLDVAASSGGGAGTRGALAGFEAEVRRRVLAARRQPALAWDRRNTCVVNYSLRVAAGGTLAGFTIDPCAVPEINEAARAAIRQAAPYPAPPGLGAGSAEVHGSLVFRP